MQQNTFYNKLIFKTKVVFLWITIKLLYGLNRFTVEGMENNASFSLLKSNFINLENLVGAKVTRIRTFAKLGIPK